MQIAQDLIVGEFSSILASQLGFLPSLDHLIRPRQHILWNCQADLLGCLEIDYQFELHRLLHRQLGGLDYVSLSVTK